MARLTAINARTLVGAIVARVNLPALGGTVVFLLIWQAAIDVFHVWPPNFVPAPTDVLASLISLVGSGTIAPDAAYSLTNLVVGYSVAVLFGGVCGLLFGTSARLRAVFMPFVWIAYTTPRIAIQPLLIIWFGFGSSPKILIIFLIAAFPILIVILEGVQSIDEKLVHVALVYGGRKIDVYRRILLPASLPFVLVALRIGLARAFIGIVVGEFIGGNIGLGFAIENAGEQFLVAQALAVSIVLVAFAFAGMAVLNVLKSWLAPWANEEGGVL